MYRSGIQISVNGQLIGSVAEAAEHCKFPRPSLYAAISHNQNSFKGYKIVKLNEKHFDLIQISQDLFSKTSETSKNHKSAIPVKCLETNTIYPSINAAAKACGEHMWTMSVKMEETGKFVDKQGNNYIRLLPMVKRTNRTYGVKSSEITRDIKPYTKKKGLAMFVRNTPVLQETPSINPNTISKKETIVKNLVNSASLLTETKNYAEAAQILTILETFDK